MCLQRTEAHRIGKRFASLKLVKHAKQGQSLGKQAEHQQDHRGAQVGKGEGRGGGGAAASQPYENTDSD